jgi:hypothetical protein
MGVSHPEVWRPDRYALILRDIRAGGRSVLKDEGEEDGWQSFCFIGK